MAWLYVPGLGGSTLDCPSPSEVTTELFVTSSGTPLPRLVSWRGWKTRPWMLRLFGTISRPSMADAGVGLWISSLRDTRASPSRSLESDLASSMSGTCGRMYSELLEKCSRAASSSKTLQLTLEWDTPKSSEICRDLATALGQDCLRRRKLARRMGGSGYSSWPTAMVQDVKHGSMSPAQMKRQSPGLACASIAWPTPAARDHKGSLPIAQRNRTMGTLDEAAEQIWQTPTGSMMPSRKQVGATEREALLPDQAENWATPMAMDGVKPSAGKRKASDLSHQAQAHRESGPQCSHNTHTSPPQSQKRRLNPAFVQWLMGFPQGWTNFGALEMPSFQAWRELHLCVLRRNLGLDLENNK